MHNLLILVLMCCVQIISALNNDEVEYYDSKPMENYDDDYEQVVAEANQFVPVYDDQTTRNEDQFLTMIPCEHRDSIRTCDCSFSNQLMTMPIMSGSIFHIVIRNCKQLQLRSETIAALTHLNWVEFVNIENLILEEHALAVRRIDNTLRVQISFSNVVIETLTRHAISGLIQRIFFTNCRLGVIDQFSITGIRSSLLELTIRDTTINRFNTQAIKKFTIDRLELNNVTVSNDLPSRSFYDVEIAEIFLIQNCDLNRVLSSAFAMKGVPVFQLQNNHIQTLSGEAFSMSVMSQVQISNNHISDMHSAAFRAIKLDPAYWSHHTTALHFSLSSNTIRMSPEPTAFELESDFNVVVQNLTYTNVISCKTIEPMKSDPFFTDNSVQIYFPFEEAVDHTKFYTIGQLLHYRCMEKSWFWYYILIGSTLATIFILALIIGICVWWRRRQARRMDIVMPEGKTYRETQIVMQIENHGLLKTDL